MTLQLVPTKDVQGFLNKSSINHSIKKLINTFCCLVNMWLQTVLHTYVHTLSVTSQGLVLKNAKTLPVDQKRGINDKGIWRGEERGRV